jgi:hypothetical protein
LVNLLYAYMGSAALMLAAGAIEAIYGIRAEKQSLETLAAPLSAQELDRV